MGVIEPTGAPWPGPRDGANALKRKMAAIVAADVAGYSRLVAEDEEGTLRRLAEYRTVFDGCIGRHGGRIFNTAGDSVMSEFDSVVEAVRAAVEIQTTLRSRNLSFAPTQRLEFRMGITVGDVVERNGDLLGDGVNIAARLQALASPGGICVSRTVQEAAAAKVPVSFRDLGPQGLKHIPNPVHAYMVAWPGERVVAPLAAERRTARRAARGGVPWRALRWAAVVLAIIFIVLPTLRLVRRTIEKQGGMQAIETVAPPSRAAGDGPKPAETKPAETKPTETKPADVKAADRKPAAATKPVKAALPADPSAAFTQLANDPKPIANATTVPELYHNARVLETKGDALGARRAYLTLVRLPGDFIDPQLRLAALLRIQDGRAGAREVYADLAASNQARTVQLVYAQQLPPADRRNKIEAMVADDPDFVPGWFALAGVYGDESGAVPTLTDRRLEYDALDRVLTADEEGKLAAFFLDQRMRAEWVENAKRRKAAIEARFSGAATRPTASFRRGEQGWLAAVTLPEPATGITYRVGDSGAFVPVAAAEGADAGSRKPTATANFSLPADQQRTTVYLSYNDLSGGRAGPFPIPFDPREALAANQRQVLQLTSGSWLDWAADRDLIYFNHLIVYRCALKEARIGFGDGPIDMVLPLPPCDEAQPFNVPADARVSLPVPADVSGVSVALTYTDGSPSETKSFKRP